MIGANITLLQTKHIIWRRERDSNPRYGFPYSGFQDRPFQPLTHPSAGRSKSRLRLVYIRGNTVPVHTRSSSTCDGQLNRRVKVARIRGGAPHSDWRARPHRIFDQTLTGPSFTSSRKLGNETPLPGRSERGNRAS